ncbi:MAG: YlbF family regulator [Ruminococcus sp.]|nr:YlbF family regulator [Ruminococcus sp.]
MNVTEAARELGKILQSDPRYTAYAAAKQANDKDEELQKKIAEFNSTKMELNVQLAANDKDTDTITSLDDKLRKLYEEITGSPKMIAYETARSEMDKVLESVNYIITASANGEDPMTCPDTPPASCTGSCASCGGCG